MIVIFICDSLNVVLEGPLVSLLDIFRYVDAIPEPLRFLLVVLGIIFIIKEIFRCLIHTFRVVEQFCLTIKLKVYYPVVTRIMRRKHKGFIRDYLRRLTMPIDEEWGLSYSVDVEWSDEERVYADLESGRLIIRLPYEEALHKVIARALLMSAPYGVSEYLEAIFGSRLAQVLSIALARDYASRDVNVLREFVSYVEEAFESDRELKELIDYVSKADDTSLYRHIVLYEIRRVLEEYDGRVIKEKLREDVEKLIRLVVLLREDINVPLLCGHYISLVIVRAGKIEKVLLEEWDRYVEIINNCMKECSKIRRIYVISAGIVVKAVARKLIKYLIDHVRGIKLIKEHFYRARYYKGRPGVRCYVAILEVTEGVFST